ncbi:hypothetical protein [Capnocytophaga sp.]|uniref:hypothetical protein n=1 Tax=Capnocytophaga sp. TaxID=44737 RepID=UPI0026DADCB4|nr:hypothetical protein [Capnocytophaga sp.]MDO5105251.1 hypothetical protein [Capnocytophaga sp.]
MRPIIDLIDNHLFSFEPISAVDWKMLTDKDQAEAFLYNDDNETVWLDLREKNDLDWTFPRDSQETEWKVLQKDILEALQKAGFEAYYDEVEYDLLNCYLNIKHKQNNPLWNQVFKAYRKGAFPCGWQGAYPKGKLVVFHPKYQPDAVQKLQDLVSDFFEKWEVLPQNPLILEHFYPFFAENAEIHTDTDEEYIGLEKIKVFYQKIVQENKEIKCLWQKQRTNNKNYFEVRVGFVLKTKNGAIKSETRTMGFDIQNDKIHRLEIVK